MKIDKTIKTELQRLYNNHLESSRISNRRLINQALDLSEAYPEDFTCELVGSLPTRYVFTVRHLGRLPDFFKSINETF